MLLLTSQVDISCKDDINKAEKLNNFREFDFWLYSDAPEVKRLVDHVWSKLLDSNAGKIFTLRTGLISISGRQTKEAIKPILLELFSRWIQDPDGYLSISRNVHSYRRNTPFVLVSRKEFFFFDL